MNAKDEFLKHVAKNGDVICAWIEVIPAIKSEKIAQLNIGYSASEYNNFLQFLDFDLQENHTENLRFDGMVWLSNGFFQVNKRNGLEVWSKTQPPKIPKFLK